MQCPVCKRENRPSSRFCIYCGARLVDTAAADSREQPRDVREEIRSLRELLSQVSNRLDALERGQPPVVPSPEPEPAAPEPVPEYVPAETPPLEPPTEEPEIVAAPVPKSIITPAIEKPPRKEREWEQILGGSWLARIGVLAIIIGIGFFLKYAFDNDWLGPTGRVVLGIVAGLIILGAGYRWRKRYPIMTRVLSGGGIAVLYLSFFASFALYDLINFYVVLVLLFLISIGSALLALRYNSMSLAILGIIGAFLAPFILGAFREGTTDTGGTTQAVQLLVYIIVVDLGVLILATFRNWRWFTLLALFCSLISFLAWYDEFDRVISNLTAETGITLIFIVFVGATTLFHIVWRHIAPRASDFSLMTINATAYFGISLGLMWDDYRGWVGLYVFLMAALYGLISYLAYRRHVVSQLLSWFSLGIALVFFTVAISLQIGDKAWVTVVWSAEGAVLMWLAFKAGINTFRYFGYVVFAAAAIRLMAFDTTVELATFQPVLNERFLAFIVGIAALGAATYFSWKNRSEEFRYEYLVFLVIADFFTMWLITAEAYTYSLQTMTTGSSVSLLVLAVLAGVALFHRFIWQQESWKLDIFLILFNTVAFIITSAFLWDDLRAWMGLLYFVLALFYGGLTYMYARRSGDRPVLSALTTAFSVIFLMTALAIQLENSVRTTITWAIVGMDLMILFYYFRRLEFRVFGILVFTAVVIRLLFFDTSVEIESFRPVINERFLAFIIGIAALYVSVYFRWRERKENKQAKTDIIVFLLVTNFLTIWILSVEVWDYFRHALITADISSREGLSDAQNLALTGVWAVYAVVLLVVGFWRRWRYLRIGGLALLVVPIVKVFVYDVFKLELGYRIGAFVGLGVLLLVSAYLYQRYSKVIKGVFTEK